MQRWENNLMAVVSYENVCWNLTEDRKPGKSMSILVVRDDDIVQSGVYWPNDDRVLLYPEDFGSEPISSFRWWTPFPNGPSD